MLQRIIIKKTQVTNNFSLKGGREGRGSGWGEQGGGGRSGQAVNGDTGNDGGGSGRVAETAPQDRCVLVVAPSSCLSVACDTIQ